MKREDCYRMVSTASAVDGVTNRTVSILAVGDPGEWARAGHRLPNDGDLAFVAFHEVGRDLLEHLSPEVVLSPLLARGFDCFDLAEVLTRAGYTGKFRAVSRPLPRPELIEAELRQLCPSIDFGLLTTD